VRILKKENGNMNQQGSLDRGGETETSTNDRKVGYAGSPNIPPALPARIDTKKKIRVCPLRGGKTKLQKGVLETYLAVWLGAKHCGKRGQAGWRKGFGGNRLPTRYTLWVKVGKKKGKKPTQKTERLGQKFAS